MWIRVKANGSGFEWHFYPPQAMGNEQHENSPVCFLGKEEVEF